MKLFKKDKYPKHLVEQDLTFGKQVIVFVWEIFKVVVISLAIIIPVRYFLIKPFYVKGASMEPNFHDYEYLIIDELSYRFTEPDRGEVVVFRYPQDPRQYFIKRVIGFPGENIRISGGKIQIINQTNPQGAALNEPYLDQAVITNGPAEISIPPGTYYLMGDNRTS